MSVIISILKCFIVVTFIIVVKDGFLNLYRYVQLSGFNAGYDQELAGF